MAEKIYMAWSNMKSRCYNPKATKYKDWGGRGIKVCDKWQKFSEFLKDMGPSYYDGLQLDRINNDGDYTPSNCRWVSRKNQSRNRRTSKFITLNGETKTLDEWTEISGLKPSTVRQRLHCYKWPIEQCFKTNKPALYGR